MAASEADDFLPLSALQHMIFCARQAALIHLEHVWLDSARTVEGADLHRVVDEGMVESRRDTLIRRGIALRSERLRLTGQSDVVEFHRLPPNEEGGCALEGQSGRWLPYPVEYKRGRPKEHRADEVQLCAQAMCLEEMLSVYLPSGALFYGETRRRLGIPLDAELRALTERTALELHAMIGCGRTPVRLREKKCDLCSLLPLCLPPHPTQDSPRIYLEHAMAAAGAAQVGG